MKRIVTHRKPDLDAVVSAWLAQDYLFAGQASEVIFAARKVPLGIEQSADCVVDAGCIYDLRRFRFDHKPPAFADRNSTCASRLIWRYLQDSGHGVAHLEGLVQVTFEGDTRKRSAALTQSRLDGPHAQLSHLAAVHRSDTLVYTHLAAWLRERYANIPLLTLQNPAGHLTGSANRLR